MKFTKLEKVFSVISLAAGIVAVSFIIAPILMEMIMSIFRNTSEIVSIAGVICAAVSLVSGILSANGEKPTELSGVGIICSLASLAFVFVILLIYLVWQFISIFI